MATDLDNAVRSIAEKVVKYVEDISTMTVETQYVTVGQEVGGNAAQPRIAARTIVRFDGDSEVVVPLSENEAGDLKVDLDLFNVHQQNVALTIEYRSKMLNSLLGVLQTRRR